MGSCIVVCVFVFKQKTAYEMRISDWSSDVCSSDLWVPGTPRPCTGAIRPATPGTCGVRASGRLNPRLACTAGRSDVASTEPPAGPLGVIGLGTMGRNLALNLAEHGTPLVVWERDPGLARTARDILLPAGTAWAAGPAELAAR